MESGLKAGRWGRLACVTDRVRLEQLAKVDVFAGLTPDALDLSGLKISVSDIQQLESIDVEGWKAEAQDIAAYYEKFGDRLPAAMKKELDGLRDRLAKA